MIMTSVILADIIMLLWKRWPQMPFMLLPLLSSAIPLVIDDYDADDPDVYSLLPLSCNNKHSLLYTSYFVFALYNYIYNSWCCYECHLYLSLACLYLFWFAFGIWCFCCWCNMWCHAILDAMSCDAYYLCCAIVMLNV